MKPLFLTAVITLALSAPVLSETSAEELFAMSNESAAETIVHETSTGDLTAAKIKFALDSMNPAERKLFFDSTHETRMEVLGCMKKVDSGDSAAESCAIDKNLSGG